MSPGQPFAPEPALAVASPDGTPIALFEVEAPGREGVEATTPAILVHGTGSDHTTWRVTGPRLAERRRVYAVDRRGQGASGDTGAWRIGREVEDLLAVAEAVARRDGRPPLLVGHSLGGRLALAAAARGARVEGVVAIEAAPMLADDPDRARQEALLARLREDVEQDDADAALARFLADVAGLPPAELDASRATPLWASRVATVPTVVRELDAALHDPAIGPGAIVAAIPVLQLVGTASPRWFTHAAIALDARLPRGRLERVAGAGHGMHHSHPEALVAAVDGLPAR